MKKVLDYLNGKKTYLGVGVGVVYSVLIYLGVVESNEIIWTAILGWTGISFRLAVK